MQFYIKVSKFRPYFQIFNILGLNGRNKLPHTDSRFRPDQRLLEEGNIDEAEKVKIAKLKELITEN